MRRLIGNRLSLFKNITLLVKRFRDEIAESHLILNAGFHRDLTVGDAVLEHELVE